MALYGDDKEVPRYSIGIKVWDDWTKKDDPPSVEVKKVVGGVYCKWMDVLPLLNELLILRTDNATLKKEIKDGNKHS